jgi:hypothetical protein
MIYSLFALDIHSALKATKDTVMALAAMIQELHEMVTNETNTHKNLMRFTGGDGGSGGGGFAASGGNAWGAQSGWNRSIDHVRSSDRMSRPSERETVIPSNINNQYHRTFDRVNSALYNTPPSELMKTCGIIVYSRVEVSKCS